MKRLLNIALWIALLFAGAAYSEFRDPTRPQGFRMDDSMADDKTAPVGQLQLQAIFYQPDRPGALINGHRYSIGDQVGDAEITAIHTDRVELQGISGLIELGLGATQVKSVSGQPLKTQSAPLSAGGKK